MRGGQERDPQGLQVRGQGATVTARLRVTTDGKGSSREEKQVVGTGISPDLLCRESRDSSVFLMEDRGA